MFIVNNWIQIKPLTIKGLSLVFAKCSFNFNENVVLSQALADKT